MCSTGRQKFEKSKASLQFQKINIDMMQFSNSAVVNINSLKSVVVYVYSLKSEVVRMKKCNGWCRHVEKCSLPAVDAALFITPVFEKNLEIVEQSLPIK